MMLIIFFVALLLAGQLWRWGGDGHVWARAVAFPALLALTKFFMVGYWLHPLNWIVLTYAPALWAMLALFSYGENAPPHKFWAWVFGTEGSTDNRIVEMFTRGTCGLFWAIPTVIFAILSGNWAAFIGGVLFLTFANAFVGGTVKNADLSERLVGMCVMIGILV